MECEHEGIFGYVKKTANNFSIIVTCTNCSRSLVQKCCKNSNILLINCKNQRVAYDEKEQIYY